MSSAMGQSSFKYTTMKDWNDLLKEVREVQSINPLFVRAG